MALVPTRELIIAALAEQVAARRADRDLDQSELPARVLWTGEDSDVQQDRYGRITLLTGASLIAQHHADADHTQWDEQGNTIMAQMIADATGGDRTLGGLCDTITYTATAVLYPGEGSSIITVGVDLAIAWGHPIGHPYTEVPD